MNDGSVAGASRLQQLGSYLKEDPSNPLILADYVDEALRNGALDAAERGLAALMASSPSTGASAAWRFREAKLKMARREYEAAQPILRELLVNAEARAATLHSLAWIEFVAKRYQACCDRLQEVVGGSFDEGGAALAALEPELRTAVQVLWLRAMHQLGRIDAAWGWASREASLHRLEAVAQGAASLIAIDAARFDMAQHMAQIALSVQPNQAEALVALATVALARRESAAARSLLERAMQQNGADGRTWSLQGYVELVEQQLPAAIAAFECATTYMPSHIGTWHGLGWSRLMVGDLAGAQGAFEHALALDRNFGETHGALAVILVLQGRAEEARTVVEVAQRLNRGGVAAGYAKALLDGEGRDAKAIHRLAARLLEGRFVPTGAPMATWLADQEGREPRPPLH